MNRQLILRYSVLMLALGIYFCLAANPLRAADDPLILEEIEFKEADLLDIIRVLSEDSGVNIIATPAASLKTITIYLKKVTVEDAVRSIARANGLWYRRDSDTGAFRLMTLEEYQKDLVVHRDDQVRVFQLRNPSVFLIADAIEKIYPDRAEVEYGENYEDLNDTVNGGGSGSGSSSGSNNSNGNRNNRNNSSRNNRNSSSGDSYGGRSSRSGGGNSYGSRTEIPNEITVDQIEAVSNPDSGITQLSTSALQQITSSQETIYVTTVNEHNLLLVRTGDNLVMQEIEKLVKKMDQPSQQVMLEMRLVEVQLGDDFRSVFNFDITDGVLDQDNVSLGNNALQGGSFVYEYVGSTLQANIEFLEQQNRVKVVASPMVVASNHRLTQLFVGEERLIVRGYSIDVIDNDNTTRTVTTPETEIVEIGTTLEITPHINPDRTVTLDIIQESSTLNNGAAVIPVTTNTGDIAELAVDTTDNSTLQGSVVAKHAYTVAVGGLIRENRSNNNRRVPWASDLPLVGNLFDSYSRDYERSEMVLMITPRIIAQPEDTTLVADQNDYYKYAPNATVSMDDNGQDILQLDISCGEQCMP